jgi:haloacetate dehalogenase
MVLPAARCVAAHVKKLMVLDISPTLTMYDKTDFAFAQAYYHWFFLTQPHPLPETLINANSEFYLRKKTGGWGSNSHAHFAPEAFAEYQHYYAMPDTVHGSCEDYRAAASIDLQHDRASLAAGQKLQCPLHVLWGERGVVHKLFAPVADWQAVSNSAVTGRAVPSGHYIPEEIPEVLLQEMFAFFK